MDKIAAWERILKPILWSAIAALILVSLINISFQTYSAYKRYLTEDAGLQDDDTLTDPQRRMLERAEVTLDRANESAEMAGTILSFLEGASVLIALALGAAAIFGFQNSRELRKDIEEERAKIEAELKKFTLFWEQIRPVEDSLRNLDRSLTAFENAQKSIQDNFGDLLQANQELSLKNYLEAYHYAKRVLERSPNNIQALYIAGWLETQYIPGMLESACQRFQEALQIDAKAPSVKAAFGVALRRMAIASKDDKEKRRLFDESLGNLLQALGQNENLIDLNRESFWGPVGGNYRDKGQIDSAIEAYERALSVTPGSSYPMGNLGALYLYQAKEQQSDEFKQKALDMFKETVRASESEIGLNPNDYFVIMDLAMANTILGAEETKYYRTAQRWLNHALSDAIGATPGMLRVSLGGWRRLFESCPEDWGQVQVNLDKAIKKIEEAMQERQPRPDEITN